jgi:hypothetical protein
MEIHDLLLWTPISTSILLFLRSVRGSRQSLWICYCKSTAPQFSTGVLTFFLVMVLGRVRMGFPPRGDLLWSHLGCHHHHLCHLPLGRQGDLCETPAHAASDAAFPVIQNPFISPFVSVKTTEIHVTSELADLPGRNASTHSFALNESGRIVSTQSLNPYSVSIGAGPTTEVTSPQSSTFPRSSTSMKFGPEKNTRQMKAAMEANKAAFSYCKCALLFFASLLITWVPSSINRVYSLAHPDAFPFPLLFVSSFVLPLQGLWNAVIYIVTSLPACKALSSQLLDYWAPSRASKSSSPYPPSITPKGSIGSSVESVKAFPYTGLRETA